MTKIQEFIFYLRSKLGNVYVWGGQGEVLTDMKDPEAWIRRRENSSTNADRAIKTYRRVLASGRRPIEAYDCSGLIINFLLGKKWIKSDTTAQGIYANLCTEKGKLPATLRDGDLVFCKSGSKMTHVGIVVGDGQTIEAKGRDDGVVQRTLAQGSWTHWGRLDCLAETTDKLVFTRVLKNGVQGEDVKALKKLLADAGYGGLTLTNGNFFGTTEKVVKQFQRDRGLTVDGKVGKNTITALGGMWRG